jgi:hypothetical protein
MPCPEELDKEYYVHFAEKRIEDFLSTKKSKTAKLKSEIKYVNYDAKSRIDAIDKDEYDSFSQLVLYLIDEGIVSKKQLLILVKLNYFKSFGNIKELLRLLDIISFFKYGEAKSIKKEKLEDQEFLIPIIQNHSSGKTKSGKDRTSYLIEDLEGILIECEKKIQSLHLSDLTMREKVAYQFEFTDGIYPSNDEDDRPILYVTEVRPVSRKRDGKEFGMNISTISLGSGKKGKFTIMHKNGLFKKMPITEGDVILCIDYKPDNGYFNLNDYKVLQ